jgi:hypothetical protein
MPTNRAGQCGETVSWQYFPRGGIARLLRIKIRSGAVPDGVTFDIAAFQRSIQGRAIKTSGLKNGLSTKRAVTDNRTQ